MSWTGSGGSSDSAGLGDTGTHPEVDAAVRLLHRRRGWGWTGGGSLLALVVPAGDPPDPAGLEAWCRDRLAPYKVPRAYEFRTELIYNAMGKPDKKAMRAPYWSSDRTIAG